jgi:hypothetical protein
VASLWASTKPSIEIGRRAKAPPGVLPAASYSVSETFSDLDISFRGNYSKMPLGAKSYPHPNRSLLSL